MRTQHTLFISYTLQVPSALCLSSYRSCLPPSSSIQSARLRGSVPIGGLSRSGGLPGLYRESIRQVAIPGGFYTIWAPSSFTLFASGFQYRWRIRPNIFHRFLIGYIQVCIHLRNQGERNACSSSGRSSRVANDLVVGYLPNSVISRGRSLNSVLVAAGQYRCRSIGQVHSHGRNPRASSSLNPYNSP